MTEPEAKGGRMARYLAAAEVEYKPLQATAERTHRRDQRMHAEHARCTLRQTLAELEHRERKYRSAGLCTLAQECRAAHWIASMRLASVEALCDAPDVLLQFEVWLAGVLDLVEASGDEVSMGCVRTFVFALTEYVGRTPEQVVADELIAHHLVGGEG